MQASIRRQSRQREPALREALPGFGEAGPTLLFHMDVNFAHSWSRDRWWRQLENQKLFVDGTHKMTRTNAIALPAVLLSKQKKVSHLGNTDVARIEIPPQTHPKP